MAEQMCISASDESDADYSSEGDDSSDSSSSSSEDEIDENCLIDFPEADQVDPDPETSGSTTSNSEDSGDEQAVPAKRSRVAGVAFKSKAPNKKSGKKYPEKCSSGAPFSLFSITGKKTYVAVNREKPNNRKTTADKRNETECQGIKSLPNGWYWTDDVPKSKPYPPFRGPKAGPTRRSKKKSAIHVFNDVSSSWMHKWIKSTNKNAQSCLLDAWKDVTILEGAAFIAGVLHMSIKKLPSLSMYWHDVEYRSEGIRSTIKRKRFFEILRFSRMFDEETAAQTGESCPKSANYDPFYRITPTLKKLIKSFQTNKSPTEHLSIDETIIAFKGRFKLKTLNPGKPGNKRLGIRIYTLADDDGYVFNCMFYSPKKIKFEEKGKLFAVVHGLLNSEGLDGKGLSFLHKGHKVYTDNLYTDVMTLVSLQNLDTYCCGTLRGTKSFLPKPLIITKPSQYRGIKFERGDAVFAYSSHDNLVFINWKDSQHVLLLSSLKYLSNEMGSCQRNLRDKKTNAFSCKTILQPKLVADYSKHMNSVDKSDQKLEIQRRHKKSAKWTAKVFDHFVHLSCANGSILYNQENEKVLPILDFKLQLINQLRLASLSIDRLPPTIEMKDNIVCFSGTTLPGDIVAALRRGHCSMKLPKGRKKCYNHDKLKRTKFFCPVCNVGLCSTNCFLKWHMH